MMMMIIIIFQSFFVVVKQRKYTSPIQIFHCQIMGEGAGRERSAIE